MGSERMILDRLHRRRLQEELKSGEFYKNKQATMDDINKDDEYVDNPDGTRYTVGKDSEGKYGVWHMTKDGDYVDDPESKESFSDINKAKEYALKAKQSKYREAVEESIDSYRDAQADILDYLRESGVQADDSTAHGHLVGGILITLPDSRKYRLLIDQTY